MYRNDNDPVGRVSIDDLKPGVTLWFCDTIQADVETADDGHVMVPFIYSGVIKSIEEVAMSRTREVVNREMHIQFENDEDGWGLTFFVGDRENYNQRFFLARDGADNEAKLWQDSNLEDAIKAVQKAELALTYIRADNETPIIETNYRVGRGSGNYLNTLLKRIEADARGEDINGVY